MAKGRRKMSKKENRKFFKKGALNIKDVNIDNKTQLRGGIRLT